MSFYFKKHGKPEQRKYTPHGRTKQSQKDETDINKMLARASREKTLSHLEKYEPMYADFSDYDFEENQKKLVQANTIFEELPAEIKREFAQSPEEFFNYVTNPENAARLPELLPAIARRGDYFPPVGKIQTRQDPLPAEQSPAGAPGARQGAQGSEATENLSPPATEDTPPSGGS